MDFGSKEGITAASWKAPPMTKPKPSGPYTINLLQMSEYVENFTTRLNDGETLLLSVLYS